MNLPHAETNILRPAAHAVTTTQATNSFTLNGLSENSPRKRIDRADAHLVEGIMAFKKFEKVLLNVAQINELLKQYKELCALREKLKANATEQRQRVFSYSPALRKETAVFEAECGKWRKTAKKTTADLFADFLLEQSLGSAQANQGSAQTEQAGAAKTSQADSNPFADNISILSVSTTSSDQPLLHHEHHGFTNSRNGEMSDYDWEVPHRGLPPGGLGRLRDSLGIQRGHWAQ